MIGMSVTEDDLPESPELIGGGEQSASHRPGPGVERDHAVVGFNQVDVHPVAEIARMAPDAIGDLLSSWGERVDRH